MNKITEFFENFNAIHSTKYRRDIDGLRGIAVLSVVICHAFPNLLPGGFVGVDIFFVISGYLISSILINELDGRQFSIWKFYDRRIRRIFPALIVVLAAAILLGWLVLFRSEFQSLGKHIVASSLFSENFLLWSEASYFDLASTKKPLLHLWSLAIEEQFYIVWPLMMYLVSRGHVKFIAMFLIVGIFSFSMNIYYVHHDMTPAYYSPLSRGWELMVGACLAYLQKEKTPLLAKYGDAQAIAGIFLIAISLCLVRPTYKFPGFWAIAPTLGTFLVISAGDGKWVNRFVLSFPPLVWAGLISYPLYLWHWIFLAFDNILFPRSRLVICGLLFLSVVASIITFVFVEMPFRGRSKGRMKPMLLLGMMMCILATGGMMYLQVIPPRLNHFDLPQQTEWDFLKSQNQKMDSNPVGIFPIESDRQRLTLFLGDSHTAQYAARVAAHVKSNQMFPGAIFAVGGGCIAIEEIYSDDLTRKKCWDMRTESYKMAGENRFSTVVIGGAWNWYFFSNEYFIYSNGQRIPLNTEKGRSEAFLHVKKSIASLVKSGKNVIFLLDNPLIDFTRLTDKTIRIDGGDFNGFHHVIKVPVPKEQLQLNAALARIATEAGAKVVDPFQAICDKEYCQMTTSSGQLLYKDDGHFNPQWVMEHADFIDEVLTN